MSGLTLLIKRNDVNVFYFFNKKLHCSMLDIIMKLITELGSTTFAVIISGFFLLQDYSSITFGTGSMLAANLILSQLAVQIIKRLVNRPRPYKTLNWAIPIKPTACIYSFPSGHTCSAFSIALVLSYVFPALDIAFISVAILVGISRIYLGCHYPTDVIFGFLIALISYMLVSEYLLINV